MTPASVLAATWPAAVIIASVIIGILVLEHEYRKGNDNERQ